MKFPILEELIQANEDSCNALIDVLMINGDSEELDNNLIDWKISSVNSTLIKLELQF